MEKKKMLIVVDMQNDFVDGVLGTSEAQAIVPGVVAKINQYKAEGNYIVYTMDTHREDYLQSQEGRNLPVKHCIYGQSGWLLNHEVEMALKGALSGLNEELKGYHKGIFGSWDLAVDLKERDNEIKEIELIGVCTGICVISNAVLIKTGLPEVPLTIGASCCACVTPQSHETALQAMRLLQIAVRY